MQHHVRHQAARRPTARSVWSARSWLPLSGAASVLFWLGSAAWTTSGAPPSLDPRVNFHKHLVLDSRVIAETNNVRLELGRVEKDTGNPLFGADRPWENALNNLYPNVTWDTGARTFKLWYKDMLPDRDVVAKMMPPRIVLKTGWLLLYATSKDGRRWVKPELGLYGFDGSTRNNIVMRDTANTGVFKDLYDPSPARRYKMVYDVGRGQLRVRFSPDGLHWGQETVPKINGGVGDTHNNAFYDPRTGNYVLISRLFQGERKVARSESRDFLDWTDAELILESLPTEKGRRQTYCMPAFAYANCYLGFLMLINTGSDNSVDCELTWSPDSVHWNRVNPGAPLLPRGPAGSYDAGCIYGPAGGPVLKDGKLWILYGGSRVFHVGTKRHCLPCWARLRQDGFAGHVPADPLRKGMMVTVPMLATGEPLRVSADAAGGALRVSVLDEEGFGFGHCRPITADVTDAEVKWRGGKRFAILKGRTVRLQFEMDAAKLYAFSGLELPGAQHPSVAPPRATAP